MQLRLEATEEWLTAFVSLFFPLYTVRVFTAHTWEITRGCIQRKTWCMGPYAGVDYISPYLIVSYPPPLQRKGGGVGKISPIGWAHSYLSAKIRSLAKAWNYEEFCFILEAKNEVCRRIQFIPVTIVTVIDHLQQCHDLSSTVIAWTKWLWRHQTINFVFPGVK